MDPTRFDALARLVGTRASRRIVLSTLVVAALGARLSAGGAGATHPGCRHAGRECGRDGQCCSGDCRSGTCRCTRVGQCPRPAATEPCRKAVCTASGKCAIRNKADGAVCDGGACQDGGCVASCEPNCTDKCGGAGDGCGGTCDAACPCKPDCDGKACGDGDGCGGACGAFNAPCDGPANCCSGVCSLTEGRCVVV